MSLVHQKICSKCNLPKDFSDYFKKSTSKDGYQSVCKKCDYASKRKNRVKNKENYFKNVLHNIKMRSIKKNYEFNLDLEWLITNCPKVCPVFETSLIIGSKNPYEIISVDRIDNNKGYTKDNCRIISWKANKVRMDSTLEDLKKLVRYLENNQ